MEEHEGEGDYLEQQSGISSRASGISGMPLRDEGCNTGRQLNQEKLLLSSPVGLRTTGWYMDSLAPLIVQNGTGWGYPVDGITSVDISATQCTDFFDKML